MSTHFRPLTNQPRVHSHTTGLTALGLHVLGWRGGGGNASASVHTGRRTAFTHKPVGAYCSTWLEKACLAVTVIQWLQAPACSWATRWVCRLMPRSRRGMGAAGRDGGDEWWARVFRRGWLQHCGTSSHTVINSHLRRRGVSFKTWLCTHTHTHTRTHTRTRKHTHAHTDQQCEARWGHLPSVCPVPHLKGCSVENKQLWKVVYSGPVHFVALCGCKCVSVIALHMLRQYSLRKFRFPKIYFLSFTWWSLTKLKLTIRFSNINET